MGGSMASKRGDLCLMIGYPRRRLPVFQRRHPALRLGFVVDSTDEPGRLFTTCYVDSGDSGGGVFDLQGRLIGIAVGESTKFGKAATDCRAVGLFQLQWDFLTSGTLPATAAPSDVGAAVTEFQRLTPSVSPIVVEVRQGEKRCSLGTIVGSDGWVLTRASTLGDSVSCRLADGRELPARIGRVSRVHDLAMIRVEATGLPEADWTEHEEIPVGTLVAAVRFPREEAPAVGMVYRAAHPAPSEPGRLPIGKGQNVEGGVEIRDLTELEAGLPAVVDSDMALAVDSFGGPVIDHSGKVVAVTFAPSAYNGLVYLLPAAIAAKVSDRLKSR
jgi:S1-C subfamily serine protease